MIGDSPAIANLKQERLRVSSEDVTVLLVGGSGTGMELVAHSIHGWHPHRR